MRGIVRRFLVILLTFCLAWVVSGGAMATAAVVMPDVTKEITTLATKAEAFMHRNDDGTYTLTASAKDLRVSQLALDRFLAALDAVNEGIRTGYFITDVQGQLQLTDKGHEVYHGGEAQRVTCTPNSRRLTANETVRFEGLLNMYSAGSVGIVALVSFMAAFFTGIAAPLLALALVVAIIGAGAYFFASWMQAVDTGNGVTINWMECGSPYHIGNVWPIPN